MKSPGRIRVWNEHYAVKLSAIKQTGKSGGTHGPILTSMKLAASGPVRDFAGADQPSALDRMTTPKLQRSAMAIAFFSCLLAASVHAQDAPDLWRAQLELGFNGSSGNSSFGILRTGGALSRAQTDIYEFEVSALVRYGKSEDRIIADDMRSTIKFDWKPASDFSPFIFVTASRDQIRKIDSRVSGGAGAKWTFGRSEDEASKASFSLAATLDREDFALDAGATEEEISITARWSTRLKLDHTFASGAKIGHVTFWQPKIDSFSDYIVEMTTSLSTRLLSNLSLAVEHEFIHDEIPAPGAKPNDQKFSVVLRVSL
jgi:hypothetical protein